MTSNMDVDGPTQRRSDVATSMPAKRSCPLPAVEFDTPFPILALHQRRATKPPNLSGLDVVVRATRGQQNLRGSRQPRCCASGPPDP